MTGVQTCALPICPSDDAAKDAGLTGNPPAKSYVDAYGSYSTNEVAINWNAPLVWSAAYLDQIGSQAYAVPEANQIAAPTPSQAKPPTSTSASWLLTGLAALLLAVGGLAIWLKRRTA